ncbi:MAG: hypothetical protein ACP5GX_09300 [Anaerolineae bacterium]
MGPAGHLAMGFAAKPTAPKAPLWVLLVATEVLDLLNFGFVVIGIEKVSLDLTDFLQGNIDLSVPWSHGLVMTVMWSVLASLIVFLVYHERRTAGVVGLLVFSHWVLDFIVHPPDLPLLPAGSTMVGLGLWTSRPGVIISFILEFVLLAGGIAIYWSKRKQATESRNG